MAKAVGLDSRIGNKFLNASIGKFLFRRSVYSISAARFWWQLFSEGRLQFNLLSGIVETRTSRSVLVASDQNQRLAARTFRSDDCAKSIRQCQRKENRDLWIRFQEGHGGYTVGEKIGRLSFELSSLENHRVFTYVNTYWLKEPRCTSTIQKCLLIESFSIFPSRPAEPKPIVR